MQPTYSADAEAYREKVQAFLAEKLPAGWAGIGSLDGAELSAFVAECTVELTVKNGRLLASASSTDETRSGDAFDYPREVQFDVPVESNSYGGTGMLFTGTVGGNAVLVTGWQASWPR
jgi:hypothetical protein